MQIMNKIDQQPN